MPVALVKSLSKESKKSRKEVERLWNKAKEIVNDEYPEIPEKDNRHWALVTGILKKMLGLKENENSFKKDFKSFVSESSLKTNDEVKNFYGISQSDIISYSKINDIKVLKESNGDYTGKIGNTVVFKYIKESLKMYSEFTPDDFLKGRISKLI